MTVRTHAPAEALSRLEDEAQRGLDVWESAIGVGKSLAEREDATRYALGDLALLVAKEYGHDRIGEFATAINRPVKRIKEYRTVCRYYPRALRDEIVAHYPSLSYSHLRLAMRLKDLDASLALLEAAHGGRWTVERATIEVDRRLGKPEPPVKLWEGEALVLSASGYSASFGFDTDIGGGWPRRVRLVVYTTETP